MRSSSNLTLEITPQIILRAYSLGIFPMAESASDPTLYWIEPDIRGVLPLNGITVPKRLARTIRQGKFEVRVDSDFDGVITGCAAPRAGRRTTWINDRIRELYGELFRMGHCHAVETWLDGRLVGGLYGVHLGGAFFGESMFSTETDASKVALVYLAARLIYGGFTLLDTQFVTDHLKQFGAVEIRRAEFQKLLDAALQTYCTGFHELPSDFPPAGILQLVSQTSKTGCSTA
jgi:leucyl/phenylalanyl-tRNA--protein transferase